MKISLRGKEKRSKEDNPKGEDADDRERRRQEEITRLSSMIFLERLGRSRL